MGNKLTEVFLLVIFLVTGLAVSACGDTLTLSATEETTGMELQVINLPEPRYTSDVSLEECLLNRRSVREYTGDPVTLPELSQLLWAAQGITNEYGHRTAPSAGGLYPLEIYVFAGNVDGLEPGIYRYLAEEHGLILITAGDKRTELAVASLDQEWVEQGALDFVITGVWQRTTEKYGDRGTRYVYMESGHAAQNICLQAAAMELGTVTIGAFHDDQIRELLDLPEGEDPLYVMPVGRK